MMIHGNKTVFRAPILFIAVLSLFALDVFDEGLGLWQTVVALAMHLRPTFFMVATLVVAWRWEWVGTLAFRLGSRRRIDPHVTASPEGGSILHGSPLVIAGGWHSSTFLPFGAPARGLPLCWTDFGHRGYE
jgi:hypothetical protein